MPAPAGNVTALSITDTDLIPHDPTVSERHLPPGATDFTRQRTIAIERAQFELRKAVPHDLQYVVPRDASDWETILVFSTLEAIYRGEGSEWFDTADHWESRLFDAVSNFNYKLDEDESGTLEDDEEAIFRGRSVRLVR